MNVEVYTGVGELNPYWRSSMNVEVEGGGRIKPLLKIFNECRSFNGGGRIKPLLKICNECRM